MNAASVVKIYLFFLETNNPDLAADLCKASNTVTSEILITVHT